MILVPTSSLQEGDRLGQHVYRSDGRLVLSRGAVLAANLISGLVRMNIDSVYIDNVRDNEAVPVSLMDSGLLRAAAVDVVRTVFAEVAGTGRFHSRPVIRLTDDMLRAIAKDGDVKLQMKEIRTEGNYLHAHSANVCMLSIMTARTLGYTEQHLRTVAIGALLHDIGYVAAQAVDARTDHPRIGFDLVRRHPDLPLLAAHVVLQHHEQLNGGGFPLGIRGEALRQSAQIVAIANDFDHFVNEIGQNRLPHEGIEYVMSKVDVSYEIAVVRAFVQRVAPYPIGTVVRLSNGMIGTVSELHKGHPSRPVIVTKDQGLRFDLLHFQTDFIEEVILDPRVLAG